MKSVSTYQGNYQEEPPPENFKCEKQESSLNTIKKEEIKSEEEPKPNVVTRISDQAELEQMMKKWTKVVLCQDVVLLRVCSLGEKCKFAHNLSELHENRLKQVKQNFSYVSKYCSL